MIESRRHLLGEVFCSYDAFPANQSFPGFQCFLHRNLLALRGPLFWASPGERSRNMAPGAASSMVATSVGSVGTILNSSVLSGPGESARRPFAASPGALSANNTRNSFPVIAENSPWRIPRVVRGKRDNATQSGGTRCDSSSRDNVWRDWRGQSSRMQMSRPQTARRG